MNQLDLLHAKKDTRKKRNRNSNLGWVWSGIFKHA